MRERVIEVVLWIWEWMKLLGVVAFAMLAGAGCYHQWLVNHPVEKPAVRYEYQTATYQEELTQMVDFDIENLEVVELCKEQIEEEGYFDDLELMAACVEAEAGNQSFDGKRMVADVILNRVFDKDFPNTITEVITQPYQFAVYWDGSMERIEEPSEETIKAVQMELEDRGWPGLFYFTAEGYSKYGTPWKKVGDHYFSTK